MGINNYPGIFNDLKGCVNDAKDWSALLQGFGFSTSTILDSGATKANVKAALQGLIASTNAGDVAVFTYSGHGTQVTDRSGDESDPYDEAISLYDGNVIDDELRVILQGIHPQATLVIVSDSCFSGSVTRIAAEPVIPRFIPRPFPPSAERPAGLSSCPKRTCPRSSSRAAVTANIPTMPNSTGVPTAQ
ncbi:MAG: caspase family protein [Candidatus Moduliflexus flocculans]|nr:caspase family protein [Candidatus Moduliflexus flocculans]